MEMQPSAFHRILTPLELRKMATETFLALYRAKNPYIMRAIQTKIEMAQAVNQNFDVMEFYNSQRQPGTFVDFPIVESLSHALVRLSPFHYLIYPGQSTKNVQILLLNIL